MWKKGLILDVDFNFDYLSLDSIVSNKVAIRAMLKQVHLRKMKVPLDVLLIFAEEVDEQMLPSLQIIFPADRSSSLRKCLHGISRYGSSLAQQSSITYGSGDVAMAGAGYMGVYGDTGVVGPGYVMGPPGPVGVLGPTGMTGAYGPMGSSSSYYSNGIIILHASKVPHINMPQITINLYKKSMVIVEYLRSDEKYSYVLSLIFGDDWYK